MPKVTCGLNRCEERLPSNKPYTKCCVCSKKLCKLHQRIIKTDNNNHFLTPIYCPICSSKTVKKVIEIEKKRKEKIQEGTSKNDALSINSSKDGSQDVLQHEQSTSIPASGDKNKTSEIRDPGSSKSV